MKTMNRVWSYGILLLAATVAVRSAATPYQDVVLADNPIGYWRLGEASGTTAGNIGSAGNAIDGTYSGGVTLGQPGAIVGDPDTAAQFNGTNGTVTVSANTALNVTSGGVTQMAVEYWVKFLSTPANDHTLVSRPVTSNNVPYRSLVKSDGDARYLAFGFFHSGADRVARDTTYDLALPENQDVWFHVVGVYDTTVGGVGEPRRLRLYVNGELAATSNPPATDIIIDQNSTLHIGSENARRYSHVVLDEVAFYNTPLTTEQVQAHFAAGIPEPGTVGLGLLGALGLIGLLRRRLG